MSKTTSSKTDSNADAKRVSFFPFPPDSPRLQKFANIYAEREGLTELNVHPGLREVFRFILDCAEQFLASSSNGHSHPPLPRRGKY